MPSKGWFLCAWKREGLPPAVRALALITLAGGLSALFASFFPASQDAPIHVLRVVGVVACAGSVLLFWQGSRLPQWSLQVAVAGGTLLISLLIARSATGFGMIITACDYMWMGVYAAFFFSRAAARAHTALIAVAFGAALLLSTQHVPADAWIFLTASLVVATETIGRQSASLRHEAHTDSLTGLLNRKGLVLAAEKAFALADRTRIPLTIALVDLDDFKQVNDRDGHAEGDRLLVQMTRTWCEELQPGDIFARLGGDEFLVILVGSYEEEATRFFEKLLFISPAPWSAGVVTRQSGEDLGACLSRADNTLYEVKHSRKPQAQPVRSAPSETPEVQLEPSY